MAFRNASGAARLAVAWLLCTLSACSGEPRALRTEAAPAERHTVPAFVVSHGWHTGVVVPATSLDRRIPALASRFSSGTPAFYEIGWGDKGFYAAADITVGLALRAMFRSDGAVMHVVAVPASPSDSFPNSEVVPICLSASGLDGLERFVDASLARDAQGRPVPQAAGIYGDSQFYDAVGRYSLLRTCNTWTANALRSAGLDLVPSTKPTAGSVMRFVRRHARSSCDPADATTPARIVSNASTHGRRIAGTPGAPA